ncbi:MAG: DUF4238 domain-containing protein [Kofleriaceae bacterium]
MTDAARRHHYVPACYLKSFAVPQDRHRGRFYVYDRSNTHTFPSSPDNAAHQRDFYRVELDGEHPNLVENTYEALETRFAPTLRSTVESGMLPKDEDGMHELLAFVATQAVRTPRVRQMQSKAYNDVSMLYFHTLGQNKNAFKKAWRDEFPGLTSEELESKYAAHVDFLAKPGARVEMDQTTLVRDALVLAGELEDILAKRSWILLVAPAESLLVTSDDPVLLRPANSNPKHPLWSPGFDDRNTEVLVPLSPRLALAGLPYEYTARARLRMNRAQVAAFNTDLALKAHRFVYSTDPNFVQLTQDGSSVVEGPIDWLSLSAQPPVPTFNFFSAD